MRYANLSQERKKKAVSLLNGLTVEFSKKSKVEAGSNKLSLYRNPRRTVNFSIRQFVQFPIESSK